MSISATYVSATSFTVTGDRTGNLPDTIRIQATMGVDGTAEGTVASTTYNSGPDTTTVVIEESVLTSNLTEIEYGPVFSDAANSTSNLSKHGHTGNDDGGDIPAAGLSQAECDLLQAIPVPGTGDAYKVIRITSGETAYEEITLQGTSNQVTVTNNANDITLALPQDIHTAANPTFDNPIFSDLQISNLTGAIFGNGASNLTAVTASGALEVLRRNAANNAYEFAVMYAKHLSDVADALTDSLAQGDIVVANATPALDRLAKGTYGQALTMTSAGAVAWGTYNHVLPSATAGETLSQYELVYSDTGDSGEWKKADASGSALVRDGWGIVIESGGIADTSTGAIQLDGLITNGSWTWTPGAKLYATDTPGAIGEAPGTNTVQIGHAVTATQIFLFPGSAAGSSGASSTETITAGEALSEHNVCYADYSDSGEWKKAQSDGTSLEANAFGICSESGGIGDGSTGEMTFQGVITNGGWSLTPGKEIWLDSTAGGITQQEPQGYGDYAKPLGIAITATKIWFSPSTGWIVGSGPTSFLVAPDYCPPAFKYKDADEITIPAGRYFKGGYRLDGQYQDNTGLSAYWDVTAFDLDVDGVSQIGGDVVSSWYSIFLTAAGTALVLPCIRVDALDYNVSNTGKTTINPADHDDGTTANDNFVDANDCFNTYRLLLLCNTAYHGSLYTIEDSVTGTPDEIIIDGDVSAEIAATEWLQMIPPDGVDCLYLGSIRLDGSGDILSFLRSGWTAEWSVEVTVDGNLSTSFADTDLATGIPPGASKLIAGFYVSNQATSADALGVDWADAGVSTTKKSVFTVFQAAGSWMSQNYPPTPIHIHGTTLISNRFQRRTSSVWYAALAGSIRIMAYEE